MINTLEKYKEKLSLRYEPMIKALELFSKHEGPLLVETGCIRMKEDWGGGMSTLIFGEWCKSNGKTMFTVDIDPKNIELVKEVCVGLDIRTAICDSVKFLEDFVSPIDFLYLDSMDCPEFDDIYSPRLLSSQVHQLKEIEVAWPKLTPDSVILLDDNDFINGGKTKFTKMFLREHGAIEIPLTTKQQSLWQKK